MSKMLHPEQVISLVVDLAARVDPGYEDDRINALVALFSYAANNWDDYASPGWIERALQDAWGDDVPPEILDAVRKEPK